MEIHNRKINKMDEYKDNLSRLSIYKDHIPKVQRGVLKDEYKWWLLSLSLFCSFLGFFLDQGDWLLLSLMVLMFVLLFFVGGLIAYLVSGSQAIFEVALALTTATRTWFLAPLFFSSNFSSKSGAYSKRWFFIIEKLSIPRWPWSLMERRGLVFEKIVGENNWISKLKLFEKINTRKFTMGDKNLQ